MNAPVVSAKLVPTWVVSKSINILWLAPKPFPLILTIVVGGPDFIERAMLGPAANDGIADPIKLNANIKAGQMIKTSSIRKMCLDITSPLPHFMDFPDKQIIY